jgi:hypothetical protein
MATDTEMMMATPPSRDRTNKTWPANHKTYKLMSKPHPSFTSYDYDNKATNYMFAIDMSIV